MTTTVARIHIVLPDDLHRQVKSAAALDGVTLKDYVIEALRRSLDEHKRGTR